MTNGGVNVKRLPLKPLAKLPCNKVPVFCYGTLQIPTLQRILFGQRVRGCSAKLHGWQRLMSHDGYWFITPRPGAAVRGKVIWLSVQQLQHCDNWEEVPYYQRERVRVLQGNRRLSTYAYTRRGAKGKAKSTSSLSAFPFPTVFKAAKQSRFAALP